MVKPPKMGLSAITVFVIVLAVLSWQACGGSGNSGGGGGGGSAPSAPTGLTPTPGNQQVSLTWAATSGATSYHVKRSTTTGGPYTQAGSPTSASFTDTGLTNGTTYFYVVSAVNSFGESANSSEVSATPILAVPSSPTGLTATAGNKLVVLAWTASSGATSYNVKRSLTTGGPYTFLNAPTTAGFTDTGLTNGTTYFYVVSAVNTAGESANSSQASATPNVIPATPTGFTATAGNLQVSLAWTASAGAVTYNVKRATTTGGPYTTVFSPTTNSYVNTALTNGTTYFYVVSAVNAAGESANSVEKSATPQATTSVSVSIDVLTNRHSISPYAYGGAFPKNANTITDSGLSVVRWGGNGASTYNWKLFTTNADNDYFFEDFSFGALNNSADSNSTQFIQDVKTAGSAPLMTMVMLPWVAQSAETSTQQGTGANNYHWTFSVSQDGACNATAKVDQFNVDAGVNLQSDCSTTMVASSTQLNRTYFPLLDDHTQSCPVATCVYRNEWASALATAFGSAPHFYNMDNEIDIWGGTHIDVHPQQSGYNELRDTYLSEARLLKTWDPSAIRLGPVSCCWYFYWNLNSTTDDKATHAGIDFLPWWLNDVAWSDAATGSRSLEMFDIHAYPDGPDTSSYTTTQKKALAARIYRDWWDPTYTSEAAYIIGGGFSIEPIDSKPFRIPRIRALVNQIYPGTLFSMTEWSAAFAGESDYSTAIGDADAYGIVGREHVYLSTRWTAPDPANPNYQALKLFTNYDGSHHGFNTISVSDTNNASANLFSSYAAVNSAGTSMTVLVLNKDPGNAAQISFSLNGFTPSTETSYTLSPSTPTSIVASSSQAWSANQTFAPYTATLLVITGTTANKPSSEWDLNPDTVMVAAGGTVTLSPKITSGTANVTLGSAAFDSSEGVAACSGNITLTNSAITTIEPGTVTVTAGTTPGFCHFSVTGTDSSSVSQSQGGWIVVGKPAATLNKTGDNQTGGTLTLTATLVPGSSGGTATGASVFFTTDKGTLSQRIAVTDSSGHASVTLTLPSGTGTAHVTAEGPYGLGHPLVTFTETSP